MGNEYEGIRMAKRAIERKKERVTQKDCRHRNMVFKVVDTYTQDAREIRYKVGTCPDCGKYEKTVLWEASISPETIRKM